MFHLCFHTAKFGVRFLLKFPFAQTFPHYLWLLSIFTMMLLKDVGEQPFCTCCCFLMESFWSCSKVLFGLPASESLNLSLLSIPFWFVKLSSVSWLGASDWTIFSWTMCTHKHVLVASWNKLLDVYYPLCGQNKKKKKNQWNRWKQFQRQYILWNPSLRPDIVMNKYIFLKDIRRLWLQDSFKTDW